MTSSAAYSLRNNLDEVKSIGVKIVQKNELEDLKGESFHLDEIMLIQYEKFLQSFGETLKDVNLVAISVKDHGVPNKGLSNREFRMKKFKELLREDRDIGRFLLFENRIPDCFLRMRSSVDSSKSFLPDTKVVVMDTSPSAIIGCMQDHRISKTSPILAVNIGNGHTMAALISDNQLLGLFEHHTNSLTARKLEELLNSFAEGELTHKEVFDDGGHGVIYLGDTPRLSEINTIAVTGPRRRLLYDSSLEFVLAAPGGDIMMTGTMGILHAARESVSKWLQEKNV
jgi:uncharacterized protein (DUF1786 family)